MTDELRKSVQRIRKLAPSINDATDRAAKTVARVEHFLNDECSIGLPVEVEFSTEDREGDRERRRYLVYDRVDGKFRIAIAHEMVEKVSIEGRTTVNPCDRTRYVRESITAWGSCPRSEKLMAFEKLPLLLEWLSKKVEEVSERVDGSASAVDSIMKAMNGK